MDRPTTLNDLFFDAMERFRERTAMLSDLTTMLDALLAPKGSL